MKKASLLLLLVIFSLILSFLVLAADNVLDPNIPQNWYNAPKTASQMGITEFHQSPMLDKEVADGKLPPLKDRLPKDPPVVVPYKHVGKYGGTADVWGTSLDFGSDYRNIGVLPEAGGRVTPDGRKIVPYLFESWEYSNNSKTLTVHLRKGLRYSNGELFDSSSYTFWWKHVAHNKDLTPVPPEEAKPIATLSVTAPDQWTVVFKYSKPNPRRDDFGLQDYLLIPWAVQEPKFFEQLNPDFVNMDKLTELAKDAGLDNWYNYYTRIRDKSYFHPEYKFERPTLLPYVAVKRTESLLVLERNPYYPFVDTQGNQLPYIDKINVHLANNRKMAALKMVTGEASINARYTDPVNLPLYKSNEKKENYTTRLFRKAFGSDISIQFNLSHKNPKLRKIFLNKTFRQALSLAIDRKTINQKVYFGLAKPMQATVPPTSKYYKDAYGKAYASFDLAKAKEMLDSIGMKDVNGDGWREMPDGTPFKSTFLYTNVPVDPTPQLELIKGTWAEAGININLKMVDRALHDEARAANNFDISEWTTDNVTDVGFGSPDHVAKAFAPEPVSIELSPWPGYITWIQNDGEEGIEPPDEILWLRKLADELASAPTQAERDKAAIQLLQAQADNLWVIGTVALPPQPIMVNNDLKNVPTTGLWDWSMRYMTSYYPIQFYLDK